MGFQSTQIKTPIKIRTTTTQLQFNDDEDDDDNDYDGITKYSTVVTLGSLTQSKLTLT